MKLFKMKIRTASGFVYEYPHVASIRYASPRYIDFVSFDMIHTRIWSDDAKSLFLEITMEEEDQIVGSKDDMDRESKMLHNSVYGSEVY